MSFTSSQLMRQQLDVTQPVALLIDRRSDVLTFHRRIQQDGDGVTALVFGVEQEKAARRGEPATDKLSPEWRQRLEDILWAMLNAPEWAFSP